MIESIIILLLLMAALAAAVVINSYRRFSAARQRLIEYLQHAAPEITVRRPTTVGLVVDVLGADVEVDLASLLRTRPAAIPDTAWFDRVIDGIRATVPTPKPAPFPLVVDRVMPLLKPLTFVEVFERYPPAVRLAWRPLAPGVAVTYVVTGMDQRTLVTAGMLEVWRTTADALHTLAVENLRKQTQHILAEIGGARARYEHLDGFDATRILVADLIIPPEIAAPVLAIPEETVLLIASATERKALAAEAASRYAVSARPLSPGVYRLSAGEPTAAP